MCGAVHLKSAGMRHIEGNVQFYGSSCRAMLTRSDISYSLSGSQTWCYLRTKYGIGGESNYSAGMNNGVGKLPTSVKALREDLHSFYSYKL